ncbi:hypothetical protein Patl1_08921 [Pistacia atlantica]|uniref:Uncharacterized protein n=1 Tax=Pistacia atlantica TaxID=434234 RepID=A0ACC1AFV5_9ROSI|nr:hypothetical protein Patl1_08921 [Pistacia atlantica]
MTKMMDFAILMAYYLLFWLLLINNRAMSEPEEYQTYIIHLDHSQKPESFLTHESWHHSIFNSLSSADETEMLLYSYNHVMHGFSARLTPSHLSEIEKSPAHLATYPESFGKLYTTHTPRFLGLKHDSGIWPAASYGEGVIIGIVDTGIWPESESLSDNGMPSIPQRWNGKCENGTIFSSSDCNRKLIGAQSFSKGLQAAGIKISKKYDFDSPRDFYGHGTHTSSTAAGNQVLGVSHFGYARGTARGIAPAAHVAMYKVFWATDTDESAATDVLAAIASLSAIEKGIFVVGAAGNDGGHNSIHNGAPWIMTAGASSVDRSFTASLTLEDGFSLEGISYFPQSIYLTNASLYYGEGNISKAVCNHKALDSNEVTGKVESRARIKGMRFLTTKLGSKPAPQVAYFSSRGLDPITPGVLKPDILAPGVDVVAAVTPNMPFMTIGNYDLVSDYELWSGTSMATPHVAGVAALLKSVHWDWSPAAIRSAMMTTAYNIDNTGNILKDENTGLPATPLDFGAGHIDPNKAMDPGLIYDMDFQDYIEFLCGLDYDQSQMKALIRRNQWNCSKEHTELNYPSFIAIFTNETVKRFSRNVKNLGEKESEYHANLELPTGMRIRTEPSTLTFTQNYQKQGFVLSIEIDKKASNVTYGYLKWIDQHNHTVSSPIVAIKT